MLLPTNCSDASIPPNTSSRAIPALYGPANTGLVNFHAFQTGTVPRLGTFFWRTWSPLFYYTALLCRCIWTVIVALLVFISFRRDLNRGYSEVAALLSFPAMSNSSVRQFMQIPWPAACLTISTDAWAKTETFILPVAIWSCTMGGFWNSWRFLRLVAWQVFLASLPCHFAYVLNVLALIVTVAFDYERGGMTYWPCFCTH
jgi:hypothetical protein